MTTRTERPASPDDGPLAAFWATVVPTILLALKSVREQEPEAYSALNHAIGQRQVRLQLAVTVGVGIPSQVALNAIDGQGDPTLLCGFELPQVELN